MKIIFQQLSSNSKYIKALEWSKLVTITGGSQAIVQIVGLVSGVIVIRLLPTKEYALYTLANSMLATMVILADSGVTIAVMSEGGKVWSDRKKLGSVLSTGLDLRKKFTVYSLLISTPILAYLLLHHGASKIIAFAIIASTIPAFLAAMSDSIYEIPPKPHQDIKPLQKNQVTVSFLRIILSSAILLVFPLSFLVILANAIPRIYDNIKLKGLAYNRASFNELPDIQAKQRVLKIVKLSLPGLIYYCLSGQLNVWLISFFGQTKSIATLGAISRLTMGVSLVSSIAAVLIIPRFARLSNYRNILKPAFIKLQFLFLLISIMILATTWITGKKLLWVIGSNYGGLENELFLAMVSACITMLVGATYSLYSTKGWVMLPIYSISISILSTIIGILLFNVSTLKGVLYVNIFVSSIEYISYLTYSYNKLDNLEEFAA